MPENDLNFCVVVPTYNNVRTVRTVLDEVVAQHVPVIVVNDGATDGTDQILNDYPGIHLITHAQNQGKGSALQSAFAFALDQGYDYAITIDSDGQHSPSDLPLMMEAIRQNPGRLIMGARTMNSAGIPKKSSFGNQFSNFWFWAETGIRLSDTQTGFRAYPLTPMADMKWFTSKFEFEIEVIVRLAWKNVKFAEQPIAVAYEEDRVSHFRPLKDFSRISVLNTVLFPAALLFFLPRLWLMNFSFSSFWQQIVREFSVGSHHPVKLAGSVGVGLFFGIFPVWGFQMILAFAVASILRLNRVLVLLSSNISIVPMMPLIIYMSFLTGGLFFTESVQIGRWSDLTLESIHLGLAQYVLGASVLALLVAVAGFFLTWFTALVFRRRAS